MVENEENDEIFLGKDEQNNSKQSKVDETPIDYEQRIDELNDLLEKEKQKSLRFLPLFHIYFLHEQNLHTQLKNSKLFCLHVH